MKPEHLSLKQLRALQEIVQNGSISAAAKKLGLTAPAIHNQLKLLEENVGAPLLHRGKGEHFRPTPKGEILLAAQEEVSAALQRSIGRIQALDNGNSGRTVLGVVSTAKYFAPKIVAQLHRSKPEIEVVLKVGNRREIIAGLERNEFDLCIMGRPPRMPDLRAVALADHPHVIVAAPDNPLASRNGLSLDDIIHEKIIMREAGSGTRMLAGRFLSDANYIGQTDLVDMDSNETIKQAVMSGLGIALLSAHTIRDELEQGRISVLDVRGTPIRRKWYLLAPGVGNDFQNCNNTVYEWIVENSARILAF